MAPNSSSDNKSIGHRYQLVEKLGQGGMGVVYKAQDKLTETTIALKHVSAPTETLQFASKGSESDGAIALATEFHILAGLRHPNIVAVLDYGFSNKHFPFYTMELLVDAKSITEYQKEMDTASKLDLIVQMLQALAYLHRRGVVHRDIKPGNVQVTGQGIVKVMDFGLALDPGETKSAVEMQGLTGTIAYMAPELFEENPATYQSDLYAVGVIIYEMLAGKHPFAAKGVGAMIHQILSAEPDLSAFVPPLAAVIKRLLSKKPEQRYSNPIEVIEALCLATDRPIPKESLPLRESFLQASSFIGRDNELKNLREALKSALDGSGSVWLVGGESGIGKTRLLNELRTRGLVQGAVVLRGQGATETGDIHQIWRDPVRQLALSVPLTDLEAGILESVVPDISTLINRSFSPAPVVEGKAGISRLALTLAEAFARYCRDIGPLVLLLEDLQWAQQGLEPLKNLIRLAPQLPLLIAATYRDDEAPNLPEQLAGVNVLKLGRFSDDSIIKISESMLGPSGRSPQIIDLLKRETEGNAFFMVEVIRALAEEAGSLTDIGRKSLPEKVIAGGIQQIVRRRIERVPVEMQGWLKVAAVLGREINIEVLIAALNHGSSPATKEQIDHWLHVCAEAAVVEVADEKWRFSHDKLRETLLINLSPVESAEMNRLAAEGIEAVYEDKSNLAPILFEHWSVAGNFEKSLPYGLIHADQMANMGDYLALSKITAVTLKQLEGRTGRENDTFRMKFLLHEGLAFDGLGESELSLQRCDESLALARQLGDVSTEIESLIYKSGILVDLGKMDDAKPLLDLALQRAEEKGDLVRHAKVHNRYGIYAYRTSDFEKAQRHFQETVNIYEKLGNAQLAAANLINLGSVSLIRGKRDLAREYWTKSLTGLRATGHVRGIAQSLQGLGNIARDEGKFDEAWAWYEEGIAIFRRTGNLQSEAQLLEELGRLRAMQGDFAEGMAYYNKSLELRLKIKERAGSGVVLNSIGTLYYVQREYSLAYKYIREAVEIFREVQDTSYLAFALADMALLDLMTGGEIEPVRERLVTCLDLAYQVQSSEAILGTLAGFARLYLAEEKPVASAELVGLVATHPSQTAHIQFSYVNGVQEDLKLSLSEAEFKSAYERGAAMDYEAVIKGLLPVKKDS